MSRGENSRQWEQLVQRPCGRNQPRKFREQKGTGRTGVQREEGLEEWAGGPGKGGKWVPHPAQATIHPS